MLFCKNRHNDRCNILFYIAHSVARVRCNVKNYTKKKPLLRKECTPAIQISMKCSVALHCLIFIHEAKGGARVTSTLLVESTGCNPVVIPNILRAMKTVGGSRYTRTPAASNSAPIPAPDPPLPDLCHTGTGRRESPNSGFIPVRDAPARWHKTSGRCCRRPTIKSRTPSGPPWKASRCNPRWMISTA